MTQLSTIWYIMVYNIYLHTYAPIIRVFITLTHAHTCTHDVRPLIGIGVGNFVCDFLLFSHGYKYY